MVTSLEAVLKRVAAERERLVAVIVHLNDTYAVDERADRGLPGFPRVIGTVKLLRNGVREVMGEDRLIAVHSGDFLGPSRVGKKTRGKLMTRLLNELGLDWCVLGNHEFDYGRETLIACMRDASFRVTIANVTTDDIEVKPHVLWPSDREPLLALTGIVSETVHKSFPDGWELSSPHETLRKFGDDFARLPFRIALTHATREEDRLLRRGLPRRTILLGGHDHDIDWAERDGAPIMKNLANLQQIRVLLLLAGGHIALNNVIAHHDEIYRARCAAAGRVASLLPRFDATPDPFALVYPNDVGEVLSAAPGIDARALAASLRGVNLSTLERPQALLNVLVRSRPGADDVDFVLRYHDHKVVDEHAQTLILEALSGGANESEVIRDASDVLPTGWDVADAVNRTSVTAFGVFTAECVRREVGADLAVLNSGAFRVDGMMPARLELRDLLDCFLYDDRDAVVVVELNRATAQALLDHGRGRSGTGGFPQVSPDTLPAKDPLRVAISAYLIEDPRTIDQYNDVLAEQWGITKDDLPKRVRDCALSRTSIVDAVRKQAALVDVPRFESAILVPSLAEEFIARIQHYRSLSPSDPGISMMLLSSDDPLDNAALGEARDSVREWIRGLPEVRHAETVPLASLEGYERCMNAHEKLRELIQVMEGHRATFRDKVDYGGYLDFAAVGIVGWRR